MYRKFQNSIDFLKQQINKRWWGTVFKMEDSCEETM